MTLTLEPAGPLFPLPDPPGLKVEGRRARFPVGRIFCVGRNYADHAREMGAQAPETPFFFTKPATAIAQDGDVISYPEDTSLLHHEVELVACLDAPLHRASEEEALAAILGYAVGLDLTRRDLQNDLKSRGLPWDMAKGFDHSAPVGAIRPAADMPEHPPRGLIELAVNGQPRQRASLTDMIHGVGGLLCFLSRHIRLMPGDILFTGTPAGVGPLVPGDRLDARIEDVGDLSVTIK